MKILMLSQFFAPVAGGEERVVEDLSRELLARGHEVAVGTLRLDGTAPNEDKDGVRVHRVESFFGRFGQIYEESDRRHLPPAPDPQVVAGLRRVLAAEQPDVVHAHNWIVHSYLPRRRRDGPPLALSLHDYSLVCANKRLMRFGSPCSGPSPAKCLRCAASYYGVVKGPMVAGALLAGAPSLRRRVGMYLPVSAAVAKVLRLEQQRLPFEVVPNLMPERTDDEPGHAYHLFVCRSPERDRIRAALKEASIGSAVYYATPLHLQPALAYLGYERGSLPVTEQVARENFSVPLWAGIDGDAQERVVSAVQAVAPVAS